MLERLCKMQEYFARDPVVFDEDDAVDAVDGSYEIHESIKAEQTWGQISVMMRGYTEEVGDDRSLKRVSRC